MVLSPRLKRNNYKFVPPSINLVSVKETKDTDYRCANDFEMQVISILCLLCMVAIVSGFQLAFADGNNLTDLFDTEAFRGSWNVFNKFNWIGGILNFIISAICFFIMFSSCLSTITTVGYFALRPFWDTVDEVKKSHMNQKFMGVGGYFEDAFMGKHSSGMDSIFSLLYVFVPNIKAWSEMNDEHLSSSGLTAEENIFSWFLKTGLNKIIIITMASMGFNGTLMKAYAMVADGVGAAAEHVVNYQLDETIDNIFTSGENFKFSLDDGTAKGKLQQKVAEDIYRVVIKEGQVKDAQRKQKLGSSIQTSIKKEITEGNMLTLVQANGANTDKLEADDWKYIRYSLVTNSSSDSNPGTMTLDLTQFTAGGEWKANLYVHITPILKKKAPSHNYLQT